MSSDDSISSAAKGITKGLLEWSTERIKSLVQKFKDRNIVFVEDNETIDVAKQQRQTGEWDIFNRFVENKEFRILFQMGLTLRSLKRNKKDLSPLVKRILNKYGHRGLHIAFFAQNDLFSQYIAILLRESLNNQRIKYEINNFLENIEKTVVFIKKDDDIEQKAKEIITKINANSPRTFVISAAREEAMANCQKIKEKVVEDISNYSCEYYETKHREIYFITLDEEVSP